MPELPMLSHCSSSSSRSLYKITWKLLDLHTLGRIKAIQGKEGMGRIKAIQGKEGNWSN